MPERSLTGGATSSIALRTAVMLLFPALMRCAKQPLTSECSQLEEVLEAVSVVLACSDLEPVVVYSRTARLFWCGDDWGSLECASQFIVPADDRERMACAMQTWCGSELIALHHALLLDANGEIG